LKVRVLPGNQVVNGDNKPQPLVSGKTGMLVSKQGTAELMKASAMLDQELSERERAEETLHITQFSVDRSADPVFWIGQDARLLYVNDATCRVLGYSREELLSMTIHDIDNNFPAHVWLKHWEELKKRDSLTFESTHRTKEGTTFPVEITGNYLEHKGRELSCAFAHNIAERKRSHETVQKLNKVLEQQIVELKIINKELETFNYSVSHDLRAPLIAIEGFSRILIEKQSHRLDTKGQHFLTVINKSAKKMNEMIESLHDFFSLGRKNIKAVTINMEKMVNDIISDFKSLFPDDKFRVELSALPAVQGDRKMIRQVLINLMGNAIKYSRPKGSVVIQIGGWTEKEKNIYFVKDHGIGFSVEHADKIFEVFERLHGPDEFEGTGIGLAIVKRIVHKHGGDVWAEGVVNEGATFYFSLPGKESVKYNDGDKKDGA
jgi:PAS domain S-box-containing protein